MDYTAPPPRPVLVPVLDWVVWIQARGGGRAGGRSETPGPCHNRLLWHRGRRFMPVTGHDPLAQDLGRRVDSIDVDGQLLLAGILGNMPQYRLAGLELFGPH